MDATSHLGLLLLSFPCTDWGPEPLICTPCVDSASAGSASPASFFFFSPLPLWLQTCTSDQHLIKHTQVCLKSNLEQISQDGPNTVDMTKVNTHSAHAHVRRHACTHTHTHRVALTVSNSRVMPIVFPHWVPRRKPVFYEF